MKNMKLTMFLSLFLLTISVKVSQAQEYKIGPEDYLSITFWQQQNLNSNVRVSQNGTIALPVIGSITAAGLTPTELATKIVEKISLYNKNISQASVVVTQYGSKKVYVTGHVMQPGKYAFEAIPNIWKIIMEAGGPAETARLDRIKIIRGGSESGKSVIVNLTEILKSGDKSNLPSIYPGDTINIPGTAADAGGTDMMANGGLNQTTGEDNDAFYIYGQVARPGGYPMNKQINVLEAIILAGGPLSTAKLNEVRIIFKGRPYSSVATLDLEKYAKDGILTPFLLKPGDTIYIPEKNNSVFSGILQGGLLYDILRITITAATSMLIYNLIQ